MYTHRSGDADFSRIAIIVLRHPSRFVMTTAVSTRKSASAHFSKLCALLIFILMAAVSEAKPAFLDVFLSTYKPDGASALASAKCGICHSSVPKRNPYGKEVKKALDASSDGKMTSEILQQVEGIDSDGDGWSNGDEIKAGFLPGDPTSHPTGAAPKGSAKPSQATSPKSGDSTSSSLIPTHAFHPVVVHFPIALFIFAVVLEFFGIRKQNPAVTTAALWNLGGALTSMAIVTPTGVAAWLLGQHKLEGAMLIHLCLAVSSLILMAVTLTSRKKLGSDSKVYWAILLVSAVVIGLTGHFGGQMVYG